MATIVTRSGKGAPLSIAEGDANFTNLNDDKIELSDLSITTGATGETSALSYNNTTGVFTFTPVETGDLIGLTDLSITTGAASGAGALSYNNTTGVFTFNPVDTSLVLLDLVDDTTPQLGGNLDVGNFIINTSTVNGDLELSANGTGAIVLGNITRIGGNLDIQTNTITTYTTDGDITITANGTGSVVLNGASIEVPQSISNPTGNIFLEPVSAGTVDVKADMILIGESSSSTEALITSAADSNASIKIRAAGTGTIILDDATEINGNFDIKSHSITTSTTNGFVEITNNGTGSTLITGGAGLGISSGFVAATDTDADLTLSANGTGAIVLNQAGAVVVTDTAASGNGVITGATSKGLALLTNAGANAATDPTFSLTSGGGASLTAGSGSTLTLSGNNISVTANNLVDFNNSILSEYAIKNYAADTYVPGGGSGVSGTYAPDWANGSYHYVVMTGNVTINDFGGTITTGQVIQIVKDDTVVGGNTLTFGAKFLAPGGTITQTTNGLDLYEIVCLDDTSGSEVYLIRQWNDFQ
jgi:hypothetical protein